MGIKHTPGPWFITGTMTKYVEARIPGRMIQEVAACGPTAADDGYGEQQMANARLIAAAPELLEALTDAVIDFDNWAAHEDNHPHEHLVVWVEKARAAIAKAKGEAK